MISVTPDAIPLTPTAPLRRRHNLLLGFGSRARIGKDFATEAIRQHYGAERVCRIAFADPLKFDLRPLLEPIGIDPIIVSGTTKEQIRPLMVAYGETMRSFDANYWVKRALNLIEQVRCSIIIIPDCRYPNEIQALKAAGGYYIEIDAPNIPLVNDSERKNSPLCMAQADYIVQNMVQPHSSGILIPDIDFTKRLIQVIDSLGEPVEYGLFHFND